MGARSNVPHFSNYTITFGIKGIFSVDIDIYRTVNMIPYM